MTAPLRFLAPCMLACLAGCGFTVPDLPSYDAGIDDGRTGSGSMTPVMPGDAGPSRFDAGVPGGAIDAGTPGHAFDAGTPPAIDAGAPDAGPGVAVDAGAPTCLGGYTWIAERNSCVDIDECSIGNGGCGDPTHTRCRNRPGAAPLCEDIDECAAHDPCGGYVCHDVSGAAPTCELDCPADSSDARGDGSLCVSRVRQFTLDAGRSCAVLPDGAVRCLRGSDAGFAGAAAHGGVAQLEAINGNVCGVYKDGGVFCGGTLASYIAEVTELGFRQIAPMTASVCALTASDRLRCWGAAATLPAPEGDAALFAQIDSSWYRTCGVRRDGTIACWGDGTHDEAVVNADGGSDYTQIAVGGVHTCALRDNGTIRCFLGNAALADDRVSGPNADARSDYVQVSAGDTHTCGLHADGTLTCWGSETNGEVSGPNAGDHPPFVRVSALSGVTCGFTYDDAWQCWGANFPAGFDRIEPIEPPKAVRFGGGDCLLLANGGVHCTGDEREHPGGNAALNADGGTHFVDAAVNYDGICGLGADGRLQCWGNDAYLNQITQLLAAMVADARNHDFVAVTATAYGWCGRRDDGSIDCLTPEIDNSPDPAFDGPAADGGLFVELRSDGQFAGHTCGIRTDGSLVCWAADPSMPSTAGPNASPARDYVRLALSQTATCALHSSGAISCWANDAGQVAAIAHEPRQNFVQVSTSGLHTCGVRGDGSLVCRGDDANGKVSGPSASPRRDFVDVVATGDSTCALRAGGSVQCWGGKVRNTAALIVASRQ